MQKLTGVLKRDLVREVGVGRLAGEQSATPRSQARARIIEQGDGSALVEVTCDCGRRILLECDYDKA
jgi:hypothetical protein